MNHRKLHSSEFPGNVTNALMELYCHRRLAVLVAESLQSLTHKTEAP